MANNTSKERGIRIAIDRGGTFTDCVGEHNGEEIIIKLLSEDPANYKDAPLEGIRRIMSHFLKREIPRGEPLDTTQIDSIRMGTTVATNALLERKGEKIAMVVTKGFKDCLTIGNQSRPKIFDLAIRKPDVLYEQVVEIDERVTLEDYAEDPARRITEADAQAGTKEAEGKDLVRGLSGETVRVLRRPENNDIRQKLQEVYDSGIRSIAVCLMHGYTFPEHEALIGRIAKDIGFQHISLSHELMPMVKLVPRATSVCADAYLTPAIRKYIDGFQAGFEGGLGTESVKHEKGARGARCEFMQSDGGLVDVDKFTGLKAILSGPAGGVVGYAMTSYDEETKIPVIGFDMVRKPAFLFLQYRNTDNDNSGRHKHRCISLRRGPIRARLRNNHRRRHHPISPARHQHRRCRRRLPSLLPQRTIRRGTRIRRRTSRPSVLSKGRSRHRHGCQPVSGPPAAGVLPQNLWQE